MLASMYADSSFIYVYVQESLWTSLQRQKKSLGSTLLC